MEYCVGLLLVIYFMPHQNNKTFDRMRVPHDSPDYERREPQSC